MLMYQWYISIEDIRLLVDSLPGQITMACSCRSFLNHQIIIKLPFTEKNCTRVCHFRRSYRPSSTRWVSILRQLPRHPQDSQVVPLLRRLGRRLRRRRLVLREAPGSLTSWQCRIFSGLSYFERKLLIVSLRTNHSAKCQLLESVLVPRGHSNPGWSKFSQDSSILYESSFNLITFPSVVQT